jgi:CDP-glycerol glycerophosphotransferase
MLLLSWVFFNQAFGFKFSAAALNLQRNGLSSGKVAVIVPIYNTDPFLEECLQSLKNQTYEDLEVILINDGSTDKSGKIARGYSESYENFHLLEQKNMGVSAARNNGLREAFRLHANFVSFVDSDDWVNKDYIKKMVSASVKHNSEVVVCRSIGKKTNFAKERIYDSPTSFLKDERINSIFVHHKLYKLSLLHDGSGNLITFPEKIKYGEDAAWHEVVSSGSKRFVTLPQDLYFYRQHRRGSANTSMNKVTKAKEQVKEICWVCEKIKSLNRREMDDFNFDKIFNFYFKKICYLNDEDSDKKALASRLLKNIYNLEVSEGKLQKQSEKIKILKRFSDYTPSLSA